MSLKSETTQDYGKEILAEIRKLYAKKDEPQEAYEDDMSTTTIKTFIEQMSPIQAHYETGQIEPYVSMMPLKDLRTVLLRPDETLKDYKFDNTSMEGLANIVTNFVERFVQFHDDNIGPVRGGYGADGITEDDFLQIMARIFINFMFYFKAFIQVGLANGV